MYIYVMKLNAQISPELTNIFWAEPKNMSNC